MEPTHLSCGRATIADIHGPCRKPGDIPRGLRRHIGARDHELAHFLPARRSGCGAALMPKPSVVADGLSKKFGLSLRSALKYGLLDSGRRLAGLRAEGGLRTGEFWALDEVSFTLAPGDALGIMGVNGSGKTTLL